MSTPTVEQRITRLEERADDSDLAIATLTKIATRTLVEVRTITVNLKAHMSDGHGPHEWRELTPDEVDELFD